MTARLDQLERSTRRTRFAAFIFLTLCCGLAIAGFTVRQVTDKVVTKELDIVGDDPAHPLVRVASDTDGGVIRVFDAKGSTLVLLTVDKNGNGGVAISDKDTNPVVMLSCLQNGGSIIARNGKTNSRAIVASSPERVQVLLSSPNDKIGILQAVDADGGLIRTYKGDGDTQTGAIGGGG